MKINEKKLWLCVWSAAAIIAAWAHSIVVVPIILVAGVTVWRSK